MKIYTKTGDRGDTGLLNGVRVSKADLRIDTYGTVDELNSVLGWVLSTQVVEEPLSPWLDRIQAELFQVGAELAAAGQPMKGIDLIEQDSIEVLERAIDEMEAALVPLRQFIVPGGAEVASRLHIARTVCRRAERLAVELHEKELLRTEIIEYLNRLSDFLFVAARWMNHRLKIQDRPWVSGRRQKR